MSVDIGLLSPWVGLVVARVLWLVSTPRFWLEKERGVLTPISATSTTLASLHGCRPPQVPTAPTSHGTLSSVSIHPK